MASENGDSEIDGAYAVLGQIGEYVGAPDRVKSSAVRRTDFSYRSTSLIFRCNCVIRLTFKAGNKPLT